MTTSPLPECRLHLSGAWVDGVERQPVLDKFTLQPCETLHLPSRSQVHDAVAAAQAAFKASTLTPHDRGAILDRCATVMEARAEQLVQVLAREVGFPRSDALGELKRCALTFRLSADEARRFAGEMVPVEGAPQQGGRLGFTLRVPLGVVCAITPFNAPLNTVAHKVAPAIAAGDPVVLKPSSHTPMTSQIMRGPA